MGNTQIYKSYPLRLPPYLRSSLLRGRSQRDGLWCAKTMSSLLCIRIKSFQNLDVT